jgi:5-methylcytosine-specific restriction endonuclease McrA
MAKSLLDRLSADDYALIKDSVYYEPTSSSGLRWSHEARSNSGRGHSAGDPVGRTFFVGEKAYSASNIVLIFHDIWPEDHQNCVTRKDPSQGWSDVANLQWSVHGDSRRKSCELRRLALVHSVLGHDEPDLGERYRLGALCKKSHKWNDYDLGLHRKAGNSWKCDQCERERKSKTNNSEEAKQRKKQRYLANLEENRRAARERMRAKQEAMSPDQLAKQRAYARKYMQNLHQNLGRKSRAKGMEDFVIPPHLVGSGIIAADLLAFDSLGIDLNHVSVEAVNQQLALWAHIKGMQPSPSVARLVFDQQREYWRKNPESYKIYDKERKRLRAQWRQMTDPDYVLYHRQKSKRRKAQMRDSVAIQVTGKQIRARFAEFNHRCAYCGVDGNLHIEHVIPISKGGPHALGNIVPACKDCNFSKRDHDAERWYREQPFYSELRWRKICTLLGWGRSSVGQMALL